MACAPNKAIRWTFLILLFMLIILALAGTAAWWKLRSGVEFDGLTFETTVIKRLFLQLDRGLIVRADRVEIKTPEPGDNTPPVLDSWMPLIKRWGYLIREIEIDQLVYRNHTVSVMYYDGNFLVRGNEFDVEARANYALGAYYLDFSRLKIKPYRINLSGKASYVPKEDRLLFDGFFESTWGKGEVRIDDKKGEVEAKIKTAVFTNLKGLLQQFPLDKEAVTWVSENITAESYQINQLLVQFSLQNLNDFGPENISGSATAGPTVIQFHPGLSPVRCEKVNVTFKDDRLEFTLEKPLYEGKSIAGSAVYIDNVIKPDSTLSIRIKTTTQWDETVANLLAAYDIKLPLRQLSGQTRGEVNLLFDLSEFDLQTTGTFATDSGTWDWYGVPLQTEGADVRLTDSKVTVRNAQVSYGDILSGRFRGLVDLSSQKADIESEIEHLDLTRREMTVLHASRMSLPIEIDFSGASTLIDLEQIKTSITFNEGNTAIDIGSLAAVRPFAPFLQQFTFSDGNVHISCNDLSLIRFTGEISVPDSVLSLDDHPVTVFTFQGERTPEKTFLSVNEDRIRINLSDKAEINLDQYLITVDADRIQNEQNISSLPLPVILHGQHMLLKIHDMQIPTREYNCRIKGQDMIFKAELEKGRIEYRTSGGKINFIGTGLDAGLAEVFIRFTGLAEGIVNVNLEGDADGYYGYLEFSNVVIREYLLMNNLIAFLNSIPALATFSEQGFDQEGYRVKEGMVLFDLQDKLLTIRQLRMDGTTVNCKATGWIDFANRTLKLNMELITLKDYSKIINLLPWAGYAILGEDGSLSTSLKIDGQLDNPTIETYLARDIIMSPVNLLRRTIEWPFKLFGDRKKGTRPPERENPAPMFPE